MYTGLKYVAVGPHAGSSPDSDTNSSRSPDWLLAPQANATAAGSSVLHREVARAARIALVPTSAIRYRR